MSDEQRYTVLAKSKKDGKWKPVGKNDQGKFGLVVNDANWTASEHPGIRPLKDGVKPRVQWAKETGHEVKVMKVEAWEKHVGGTGDLRLKSGAAWPTDKRTVERLKAVAADLGKPLIIISGKRTMAQQWALYNAWKAGRGNLAAYPNENAPHIRGYAADVDIVNSDGSLTSIGLNAEARKLLWKHGLVLQVASEAWHCAPKEISSWNYYQRP